MLNPSNAPSSTVELPFSCLWKQMDTNSCISEDDFGSLATWSLDRSTQKALNAVMLNESATNRPFKPLVMRPHDTFCASSLYRTILFSFANNFAGIGALPKETIFEYLQSKTSKDLYRIIRCAPEYYTARAIARNLFQASIEVGNAQIVNLLLRESIPDVQANSDIPSHNGSYYTSIEKAAALMHTGVVKVLLAHGADVNRSRPRDIMYGREACGALNCLVRGLVGIRPSKVNQIDSELFLALVNAGGKMDDDTLDYLIENDRKGRFVPFIFSKHISESHRHWSEAGIFLKVFRHSQSQTSLDVLRLMLTNNVNLNHNVEWDGRPEREGRPWKTLIDEVAFGGDLVLVETLLEYGARLTADTLPCAIESGNEHLVKVLFRLGAKTDRKGWSEQSALATAISVQNPSMIELVVGQQGLGFLEDPEHLQEAIRAASISGDISWTEYLVKKGGVLDSKQLGRGLVNAVHEGKTDVALALLDAGADTDCEYKSADTRTTVSVGEEFFCGPPLAQALQHGNARLVFALLDAGADPDYHLSSGLKPSLELAANWGDPAVVRAVIEAGANFNSYSDVGANCLALTTAIKYRNKDLALMILHAGYEVNHSILPTSYETALSAAVRTEDLDWVHFTLEWGADPHDPIALHLAWKQKSTAFDLILGKHAARYPKGRKKWGAAILKEALDCDDFKSFQQILKRGADANYYLRPGSQERGYGPDRQTTLFGYAISESNNTRIKFVEFLLQQQQISGCAPETVVSWHQPSYTPNVVRMPYTAFLVAIETGNLPTIDLFLKHGANVNFPARNWTRRTPLQKAAEIGNTDVVDLLLERGADPNGRAAHKFGGTALQLASIGGYLRIVQLLLEKGADVNAPASKIHGRTPLEGAAEHGRLDMVAFLLQAGAGQNGKDKKDFYRAMNYAQENGYLYIADLLEHYLATGRLSAPQPLFEEFVNSDMFEDMVE